MKRIIAVFWAALFIVAMMSLGVMADGEPTWTISSAQAVPGDTVNVTLTISNNPGFCAASFEIDYDRGRLQLESAAIGAEFANAMYSMDNLPNLTYLSGGGDINVNGDFLTLTFTVLDSAPEGDALISVKYDQDNINNYNEDTIAFVMVGGKVTVSVPACKHVNVTDTAAIDATCAAKGYTAGVYCNNCGTYVSGHEEIAVADHAYGIGKVTRQAKDGENGIKTYTCSVCGATKTEEFAPGEEKSSTVWVIALAVAVAAVIACSAVLVVKKKKHTN